MSTKKDRKKTALPLLRFPEFREAEPWEVRQLGDVCSTTFSGGTPDSSRKDYYGGDIPFIRSAEIDKTTTELSITEKGLKDSSAKLVKKGDVLIALYGANSGDASLAKINGAINQAILCLRSTCDHKFILNYWVLKKESIIQRYIQGGQGNLSGEIVKSVSLAFPSIPEQQKIADCLASIDELIALEGRRLEALKTYKKGLMQRLFPAEGETVPRLRFPEFREAGPWDVKRLGEVFQERNERNGSSLELLSVTISDGVAKASQLGRKNNASSDLSNYKKVYPNDIVYNSMRMWQGASGISKWHGIVSPAYTVVEPLENHNSLFWAYYFKLSESIEKFARYSQGVTSDTWNLKFPAFSVIRMAFPSLPEQQKIAACLSSLDEVIHLQVQRLAALKQHKKGLMQQLFPQEVG